MQPTTIFTIVMAAAASALPLEGRQFGDARGTINVYSGSGCEDASVVRSNIEIGPGCLTLNETYSSIQFNEYETNSGLPWYIIVFDEPKCNTFNIVGSMGPKMCSSYYPGSHHDLCAQHIFSRGFSLEFPIHPPEAALAMDRIPVEIKLAIAQSVLRESPESARMYATVSREWQALFEPTSFSSLLLNQQRLPQARTILTPERKAYVRRIHFFALLPEYKVDRSNETESEEQENNVAFFEAVAALFGFLHPWSLAQVDEPIQRGIELRISAAVTIDLQDLEGRVNRDTQSHDRRRRCYTSFVALREGLYRDLPEVSCVTKFTYSREFIHRQLVPKTCCEISTRFPRLHSIDWHLADGSHDDAFRVQLRNNFATGLSLIPDSIRHFTLSYEYDLGNDEAVQLYPETVLDPLSVALRGLSSQLETISLQGTIGSELLWEPGLDQAQEVHWPRLREMRLTGLDLTPQGKHLVSMDPEDSIWDYEGWPPFRVDRLIPIPALENPFHLALAHAAGRMPSLRSLIANWGGRDGVVVEYTVQPGGPDGRGARAAEFSYLATPLLDLPHELQEAWLQTASAHFGEGAELHFKIMYRGSLAEYYQDGKTLAAKHPGTCTWMVPEPKVVEWTRVV
ncbi:hypothetical protein PG984_001234 [Apiospora sp. TS-2023a]